MTGTVYLVGAGPGAPDLLTVRAANLLARADIVFHDALVHPDTLALATRATKIAVGKRCGKHSTAQRFINKRLGRCRAHARDRRAAEGRRSNAVRARAGGNRRARSGARVPYEVVPGITAALAAAADIGTSLTQRGSVRSFAFVTPRVGEGEHTEPLGRWHLGRPTPARSTWARTKHRQSPLHWSLRDVLRQHRWRSSKMPRFRSRGSITRRSMGCRHSPSIRSAVRRCCSSGRSSAHGRGSRHVKRRCSDRVARGRRGADAASGASSELDFRSWIFRAATIGRRCRRRDRSHNVRR